MQSNQQIIEEYNPTRASQSFYCRVVKRLISILISAGVLILFCWLYLILYLAVKLDSPGDPIFRQKRIGRNGKVFNMYKFRTMQANSEHTGSGVYSNEQDTRLTKVGKILRRTSLDELPQLVNMLKGDMSLIGPPPPLTYHPWPYENYTPEQRHMFDVRSGLTGWAQVQGRRTVEWEQRIAYNVYYAENVSFSLDVKIFFKTVAQLIRRSDNENTKKTV